MNSPRRSIDPLLPPLKSRLKKVLRPAAGRVMPTIARLAGASEVAPTREVVQPKADAGRAARTPTVDSDQLVRGASLDESLLTEVRTLVKNSERDKAVALGHALRGRPATRDLGSAVLGVALLNSSGPDKAWSVFSEIAGTPASEPVANELYAAAFGALGDDAATVLDEDIASGRYRNWSGNSLLRVAQKALVRGLHEQTRVLIKQAEEIPEGATSKAVRKELARLATWLPEGARRAPIAEVPGAINFGVMGYVQPDVISRNIGDFIQTIASMGHIVRQQNFELDGDKDIVEFARELRATTKTERLVDGPSATLNLFELNRDGNPFQALPEKTWALTFGWFMHHLFGQGFAIPFHDNLRPIILSVYVRFPEMLTPEVVDYLRRYAPIGCRDWQSVALLRAAGVPAFFSGCMTTTVDTVFRRDGEDTRDATIYVDSPQTGPGVSRTQVQAGVRDLSFVENLRQARGWVSDYHLEYDKVITSRLHCNLPSRSVGSKVTFLPKNRSDTRFGGLIDTTDEDFERIRQGILDKVSTMLQTLASGATEDEVYAKWREITAPAMAEADELLASKHLRVLDAETVASLVPAAGLDTAQAATADTIHVVVDVRRGELKHLPKLIRSIDAHTSAPVEIWLVAAGASSAERKTFLAQDLPLGVHWVDLDESALASLGSGLKPAAQQELALALTAAALPQAQRAVFLTAPALVRQDLATLAAKAPTEGSLVTATTDRHRGRQSGLALIHRVSSRQGDDNRKALDFLMAAHGLRPGEFATFDTNVMVLDLEAARRDNLSGRLTPLVVDYGMTFREALNLVVGPRRTDLDAVWNHAPGYEVQDEPAIVNWRDTTKPWSGSVTPFAAEWTAS